MKERGRFVYQKWVAKLIDESASKILGFHGRRVLSSEAGDHTCPRGSTRELLFDFVAREPDDVASLSADVDFNFIFLSNYFVLNLFFLW